MATVKIKFRPSSVDGREGTVYYQVIHDVWQGRSTPLASCFLPNGASGIPGLSSRHPMRTDDNIYCYWIKK